MINRINEMLINLFKNEKNFGKFVIVIERDPLVYTLIVKMTCLYYIRCFSCKKYL